MLSALQETSTQNALVSISIKSKPASTTDRFTRWQFLKAVTASVFEVFNFRLFDKVRFGGNVGFVFGRRTSDSFAVRTLFGEKLSEGVSYKKLSLLERRTTFLTQLVKEGAIPPVSKDTGFLARFL